MCGCIAFSPACVFLFIYFIYLFYLFMRAAVFVISCILCLKKKLLCLCVVEADQEVVALQLKGW